MSTAPVIQETEKRALTEFLIERIRTRISGRDQDDIVDQTPSRVLFAGILQPVRVVNPSSASQEAASGTAIGLDFRVRPDRPGAKVDILIEPQWSHYYAVFPTREQCLLLNRDPSQTDTSLDALASHSMAEPQVREEANPDIAGNTIEQEDESAEIPEGNVRTELGVVVLPRAWKRKDVRLKALSVSLAVGQSETVEPGSSDFANALSQARTEIASDPRIWRHLGDPDKRQRAIGTDQVLSNAKAYEEALKNVAGDAALPPLWTMSLQVDSRPDTLDPHLLRVRVLLANTTPSYDPSVADPGLQERCAFDAALRISINGGLLVPFDFLLAPKDYRSNPQMAAKGINCVAQWLPGASARLQTETLPVFLQPLYRTRDVFEITFESLDTVNPLPELEHIATAMIRHLAEWDAFLESRAPKSMQANEIEACRLDRNEFEAEIVRYRLGVESLQDNPTLLAAFRLMNRAFTRLGARSGGRLRAWRLFQIGFIVSQLPALAVREIDEKRSDSFANSLRALLNEVGVLWFPTGGGKTEAYLGLVAVAILFDRLRGKARGLTAWMRFPLRMLSLQQMARLSRVIAALNELRAEEVSVAGGDPFAIGYYVGDANTPNRISDDEMRELEYKSSRRDDMKVLRKCPHCGGDVSVEPIRATWRLAHRCSNPACFSNTSLSLGALKGTLPIFIVDNEIYRYLPSVLVGTVDKLAIIARTRYFAHLVGGVQQQCPTHGYTSYDECIERFVGCAAKKRTLTPVPGVRDPGPALLIQDELHLLKAELGVFNGHYEGLLRHLGDLAHLPPKVLAATATIEAYDTQAFHVYLSRARRYPQPSWQQGESFYATSEPATVRRFYLGILGHTRGVEEPALRTLAIYIDEIRKLKASPRQAAQILERPELTDDALRAVLRLYDLELCYVNRKATGGSIIDKLVRVERNLLSNGLGTLQAKLLTGDQSMDEVGITLERIENELYESEGPRLDTVVATNLISHGVDLERINMMTVCGMPSHYAEYVQATSRCARSHPGLIAVCFRAGDPRECSQFEFFPIMHEHMDRLIEAVAVNRFASFAPKKTVPGLLAGLLLCQWTPSLYGSRITRPLDHVPTLNIALGNKPGSKSGTQSGTVPIEELRAAIYKIIGVDSVRPPASASQIENLRKRVDDVFDDQIAAIARSLEPQLKDVLNPITSFRDVDEGIDFGSVDSADYAVRLRAR